MRLNFVIPLLIVVLLGLMGSKIRNGEVNSCSFQEPTSPLRIVLHTSTMPAYFFGVAAVVAGGLAAGAFGGGAAVAGLATGAELLLDICMAS